MWRLAKFGKPAEPHGSAPVSISGRASILAPLKSCLLEEAGGAAVCLEDELTVDVMAAALKALLSKPERLERWPPARGQRPSRTRRRI